MLKFGQQEAGFCEATRYESQNDAVQQVLKGYMACSWR